MTGALARRDLADARLLERVAVLRRTAAARRLADAREAEALEDRAAGAAAAEVATLRAELPRRRAALYRGAIGDPMDRPALDRLHRALEAAAEAIPPAEALAEAARSRAEAAAAARAEAEAAWRARTRDARRRAALHERLAAGRAEALDRLREAEIAELLSGRPR